MVKSIVIVDAMVPSLLLVDGIVSLRMDGMVASLLLVDGDGRSAIVSGRNGTFRIPNIGILSITIPENIAITSRFLTTYRGIPR